VIKRTIEQFFKLAPELLSFTSLFHAGSEGQAKNAAPPPGREQQVRDIAGSILTDELPVGGPGQLTFFWEISGISSWCALADTR